MSRARESAPDAEGAPHRVKNQGSGPDPLEAVIDATPVDRLATFSDLLEAYLYDLPAYFDEADTLAAEDVLWEIILESPHFHERWRGAGLPHVYVVEDADDPVLWNDGVLLSGGVTYRYVANVDAVYLLSITGPLAAVHEAAHLLAPGSGHGEEWRAEHRSLIQERYGDGAAMAFDDAWRGAQGETGPDTPGLGQ